MLNFSKCHQSNNLLQNKEVFLMTAIRQEAMELLERIPEDKLTYVVQIMRGVDGLYNDNQSERKEAFAKLEQLRRKGTVTDYEAELASYREEKYGK